MNDRIRSLDFVKGDNLKDFSNRREDPEEVPRRRRKTGSQKEKREGREKGNYKRNSPKFIEKYPIKISKILEGGTGDNTTSGVRVYSTR